MNLNFVPGVAFISDVHIADSLRARTLINPSAVLYEQAAARTSLSAEVGNISPRARTLINPSTVLYEQADAQSGLPAEVSIIDLDFVPGVAFNAIENVELTGDFPTALLNPRSLASKRPASSDSDLNRGPSPAKRIKTNEDCKKSTHRQEFNSSSSLELQKTSDDDDVQLVGDNIEELIYVGKVKHTYVSFYRAGNNRNNLNIIVTNPTGREFSRVDMKSSTRLSWTDIRRKQASEGPLGSPFSGLISITLQLYCKRKWAHNISKFHKGKNIQLLRPTDQFTQQEPTPRELGSIYVLRSVDEIRADVADVFDTVVSKSDKVPTREPSSHIKTELYPHQKQALYFIWDKKQDYSAEEHDYRKFYRLVITSEDTHCKQTIKKAYIMSLERALLILFIT
ncbi:hypothetical protein HBI78_243450 [Parastagonospora nodorum]|nr:hypothetical protein HBI78_243450 [Parastagonospora nodorum]